MWALALLQIPLRKGAYYHCARHGSHLCNASLQFWVGLVSRWRTDRQGEMKVEMRSSLPNRSGAESTDTKRVQWNPLGRAEASTDTAEEEIVLASETSQCFPPEWGIPLVSLPARIEWTYLIKWSILVPRRRGTEVRDTRPWLFQESSVLLRPWVTKGSCSPGGSFREGGEGPDAVRASPRSDSSGDWHIFLQCKRRLIYRKGWKIFSPPYSLIGAKPK